MTAQIVIDDSVNAPVLGSTDNPNSFLAAAHTLSNFDNTGVLGFRWTLLDRPLGSSASLSSTSASTTDITPDIAGNYLVQLETFTDVARTAADGVDRQVVGVRFAAPFDWALPAAGETTQQDSSRGWATSRERAIRDVHAFMNSGIPQLQGAVNETLTGADPETVMGGFVLDASQVPALALKLRVMGVLTLAGAGSGALRLYDMGVVGGGAVLGVLRATATLANGTAGIISVSDTALTPVAAPSAPGEIITARHRYELRAELVGGAGTDLFKVHSAGITLEG